MKLHDKILLFSLPLNILVLSRSYAHNKNKPYITPQTPTNTYRVLSECDINTSIYDTDADVKSAKENFYRQTSQRCEEYNERMITNRQKYKEQREKDIQKIILKDKMEKSLAEKVEKGCLKCGCGLGGVAAGVGLLGTAVVNELTKAATAAAIDFATKKGIVAGIEAAILKIKEIPAFLKLTNVQWSNFINGSNYNTVSGLSTAAESAMASIGKPCVSTSSTISPACDAILNKGDTWFGLVAQAGEQAAADIIESVKAIKLGKVTAESTHLYSAVGYSVIAILIVLLIMLIIYLILRYRRKKKMNKKLQYKKLLNQ
ncbi:PIR protein, putative [Plasmodium sp.]|nr:PIR protein, putative [Plasmodium sp.]